MSTNYEEKYNSLKQEYDQSLLDNDEICKEYESTIKMLTDSLESFKLEKANLENQVSKLEKEQKNYDQERETLIAHNKEKIEDIQNLNKQIEKLKTENKKIKEEKKLIKDKIIALEINNDHCQNKMRQDDDLIKDLNSQLESALEENITLQTEFELYKQKSEETLIRKDQEIKDFQNDIINKEKIIQRLNNKRTNNIKELKQKLLLPQEFFQQYQRKLTNTIVQENKNNIDNIKLSDTAKKNKNNKSIVLFDKMVTHLTETNPQYPPKFMEIYRKSLREDDTNDNNINKQNNNSTPTNQDSTKINDKLTKDINMNDNLSFRKKNSENINNDKKNLLLEVKTLKSGTIINGDLEEMESGDDKNNKEENEEYDSTGSEKKCFEDLVICDEKDFNIIPIKKLMNENKKNRDKKLAENLKNMLVRIQKRKDVLIKNQKNNNIKLAKLGYKLDIKF